MAIEFVKKLLTDPAPAFTCYANRDLSKKEAYLAPLDHFANPSAIPSLLKMIPSVPGAEKARELYSTYDGLLLYTEADVSAQGTLKFSPSTVRVFHSHMPYGHDDFIAFAHCIGASSYIHWVIRGPRTGAIYWWPWTDRPDKNTQPMADDFSAFFKLIYERPAYFFNELLLSYTRFSDGKTPIEWMPSRYLPDDGNPSVGR